MSIKQKKVDEASADEEHNVDDTLLKKPKLQSGSIEEIEITVRISQMMT